MKSWFQRTISWIMAVIKYVQKDLVDLERVMHPLPDGTVGSTTWDVCTKITNLVVLGAHAIGQMTSCECEGNNL